MNDMKSSVMASGIVWPTGHDGAIQPILEQIINHDTKAAEYESHPWHYIRLARNVTKSFDLPESLKKTLKVESDFLRKMEEWTPTIWTDLYETIDSIFVDYENKIAHTPTDPNLDAAPPPRAPPPPQPAAVAVAPAAAPAPPSPTPAPSTSPARASSCRLSNGSNPFASDASDDFSFPNPATLREVHITDHVPVKLSFAEKNHHDWRTYFYLLFREYNLRDHIDGSVDLFARRDPDWIAIDATIIRWLFLTISPDIFKAVVREGDDAHTVWTKINGLFTDNKLQRIVFLQQEFFGTLQNDQTLDAYCLRLKAISDELHDLGFKIGDDILLSILTVGLNEELRNAASNLTLMTSPTFERAVTYLKLEERRLKNLRTRAVHTTLAAGYRAPAPPAPAPPQQAPHPWTAPPLLLTLPQQPQ
ncbi:hypothetical protein QYE76_033599 [Lolium multiflorum]|uniref:Uncharacterized protein n=1 Tax=Lolium multiflorum TaxID=4521 RepID=A0AAD8QXC4_LOLMU|nr:hypothetical protein QYE76_033599 [Lolium multiflorum]